MPATHLLLLDSSSINKIFANRKIAPFDLRDLRHAFLFDLDTPDVFEEDSYSFDYNCYNEQALPENSTLITVGLVLRKSEGSFTNICCKRLSSTSDDKPEMWQTVFWMPMLVDSSAVDAESMFEPVLAAAMLLLNKVVAVVKLEPKFWYHNTNFNTVSIICTLTLAPVMDNIPELDDPPGVITNWVNVNNLFSRPLFPGDKAVLCKLLETMLN